MVTARTRGYLLALAGVLIVSPDSIILRYAKATIVDRPMAIWLIVTVKGAFMIVFNTVFTLGSFKPDERNLRSIWRGFCAGPLVIFLSALMNIGVSVGFPLSLLETTAANALLLISLNPMWAALLGWLFLRDELHRATVCAMIVCIFAILLMSWPGRLFMNALI